MHDKKNRSLHHPALSFTDNSSWFFPSSPRLSFGYYPVFSINGHQTPTQIQLSSLYAIVNLWSKSHHQDYLTKVYKTNLFPTLKRQVPHQEKIFISQLLEEFAMFLFLKSSFSLNFCNFSLFWCSELSYSSSEHLLGDLRQRYWTWIHTEHLKLQPICR